MNVGPGGFRRSVLTEAEDLLRAHWTERDPATLWPTCVQLAEAGVAFRCMKSEVKIRPIWHWKEPRVEAHIVGASLGYGLRVCLKKADGAGGAEPDAVAGARPTRTGHPRGWGVPTARRTVTGPAAHHVTGSAAGALAGSDGRGAPSPTAPAHPNPPARPFQGAKLTRVADA